MASALDNLVRVGQLKADTASLAELQGLLKSGLVRLKDAEDVRLSPESRFDLAYNAAHALSLASLRLLGYRSENRYVVFQYLIHTVSLPNEQWRVLDQAHRKRNVAEYEGDSEVDEALLGGLLRVAREVARRVEPVIVALAGA